MWLSLRDVTATFGLEVVLALAVGARDTFELASLIF